MRRSRRFVVMTLISLLAGGGGSARAQGPSGPAPRDRPAWREVLARRLPAYGHRNWVVIADSAYPMQTGAGIETVVTHAGQLEVVKAVLEELGEVKHVRPVVYLDAELPYVPEPDAPGIGKYRADLRQVLGARPPRPLPHDRIIAKLDEAGQKFRVLVLKTDLTLPYSSVFLELDCGYWSAEAERRLREAMKAVE